MTMTPILFLRQLIALFTAICLAASGSSVVWAQSLSNLDFDITAPTITHSPPIDKGVAGKAQTITAEISDNQNVERALLVHRNSSAEFYSTVDMSPDITTTTWLATINTTNDDEYVHYYIIAEDTDGNRVQKGSESNPLTIELQQTELFGAVAPVKQDNKINWLGIGLGVVAAIALIAASSGGDGDNGGITNSDDTTTCCTITFTVTSPE